MSSKTFAMNLYEYLAAALFGIIGFLVIADHNILNPANIGWLEVGDPATHYLGWLFFRNAEWHLPLGLNLEYGDVIANSVVYSDSNAILAIFFKSFNSVLPDQFQYFGIWIVVCFVLQAIFAWKILNCVTQNFYLKTLGVAFFIFSPPMLWRLYGHYNLFAHWIILAGIFLTISPWAKGREKYWVVLICIAAGTHAYILANMLVIWIVHLIDDHLNDRRSPKNTLIYCVFSIAVIFAFMWVCGYFTVQNGQDIGGYGHYKSNVLSFIDPDTWSYLVYNVPSRPAQIEGFAYLGAGSLLLLPVLLYNLIKKRPVLGSLDLGKVLPWVLVCLFIFAVSNKISIGSIDFRIPIPDFLMQIGGIFRASGRMIWPVYYVILICIIASAIVSMPRRIALPIMAFAAAFQVADTNAGWGSIKLKLTHSSKGNWSTPMQSPLWKAFAQHYKKIYIYPPEFYYENYQEIAKFAADNRLSTNAAYLARVDELKLESERKNFREYLVSGDFPDDTFYVVSETVHAFLSHKNRNSESLAITADGYRIFIPNWDKCIECLPIAKQTNPDLSYIKVGETIVPNTKEINDSYLVSGWHNPEPNGTWSRGGNSLLLLPVSGKAKSIMLHLTPFITDGLPKQGVTIIVNGQPVKSTDLVLAGVHQIEIPISDFMEGLQGDEFRYLTVEFELPDANSPANLNLGKDARELGVALRGISLF